MALQGEKTLRRTETTKSAVGRRICRQRFRPNAHTRPMIRAAGVNRASRQHHGRKGGVSAAIDGELDFAAQDSPLFVDGRAMTRSRRVALGGGAHVLHTIVNNFHRVPGFHSQQRRMGRDHGGIFFFTSERASGFHLHHADLLFRKAAQDHQRFMNVVWTLQGTPDRDAVLLAEGRNYSIVFDIQLLLRAGEIVTLDDECGFLPYVIDVAFFHQIGFENIVITPDDRGMLFALFYGVNRGKSFVLDGDGIDGLAEFVRVSMGQKKDRLFLMIYRFACQAGLIVQDQGDTVLARNIFGRYNAEFVPRNFRTKGNLLYPAARDAGTDRGSIEHAGHFYVVNVACRSGGLVPAFLAWHG